TKTAHAGLAIERGAHLVVLINPIRPLVLEGARGTIRDGGILAVASQALRITLQRRLHEGLRRHADDNPSTDILLFEPWERDLLLCDAPLMTYGLRHEVIRRGYRRTVKTILADYERHTGVLARAGIQIAARADIERRARRWSSTARPAARRTRPAPRRAAAR